MCSEEPAWKQLISHTLTTYERVPLITAIFSDRDQIEMVEKLSGDNAQNFINVIDEVTTCTLSLLGGRSVDSHQNFYAN
jgi:hypothetical protein